MKAIEDSSLVLKIVPGERPHSFRVCVPGCGVPDFELRATDAEAARMLFAMYIFNEVDGRDAVAEDGLDEMD